MSTFDVSNNKEYNSIPSIVLPFDASAMLISCSLSIHPIVFLSIYHLSVHVQHIYLVLLSLAPDQSTPYIII